MNGAKMYKVTVKFTAPYLQDRMDDIQLAESEKKRGRIVMNAGADKTPQWHADKACHKNLTGQHYIPAQQFKQAMILGGTYSKGKIGTITKSLKSQVAGTFRVTPREIIIPAYDSILSVSVNTKNGRIMKHRPQWTDLTISFEIIVSNDTISNEMVKQVLVDAGMHIGIGSWRPTKSGEYGTFEVTKFDEII